MSRRWAKPVIPIAVEKETRMVERVSGIATPRQMVELVLHDADVRRLANGQVCLNCLEPFETAYPVKCPVCCYPVRERQALEFSRNYNGTETPLTPLSEHLARFDEEDARKVYNKDARISVPKGFK